MARVCASPWEPLPLPSPTMNYCQHQELTRGPGPWCSLGPQLGHFLLAPADYGGLRGSFSAVWKVRDPSPESAKWNVCQEPQNHANQNSSLGDSGLKQSIFVNSHELLDTRKMVVLLSRLKTFSQEWKLSRPRLSKFFAFFSDWKTTKQARCGSSRLKAQHLEGWSRKYTYKQRIILTYIKIVAYRSKTFKIFF